MPGGRFAEKFSDEQRAAIVSAILDEGLSSYRATDRARDGRLADLPAFDTSPSYAYQLARWETRKRAGDAPGPTNQTADERLDRTAQRMAASLDALQRAWDKKRTRRPLELEQLAKAGIAIRRFLGGDTVAQSRQSPWARRSPSDRKDAGAGPELARIMAEHEATAGQSGPAPQPADRKSTRLNSSHRT